MIDFPSIVIMWIMRHYLAEIKNLISFKYKLNTIIE